MQLDCRKSLYKRLRAMSALGAIFLFIVASTPAIALAEETAGSGDVAAGRALFTGAKRLQNGGPPCISCHSAGNELGALGGGSLGPNLTKIWENNPFFIDVNFINDPGGPVMGPLWSRRPVTEEEVQHLQAFFASVAQQPAASSVGKFVIISIVCAVIMLIIFSILWSGRYRKRCNNTAHDALWRNYGGKGGK